jgi:hypothetical protein
MRPFYWGSCQYVMYRREVWGVYFDMTCETRVLGSLPDAHASIRACRLDPLPDMRTARLCCGTDMAARLIRVD